jgi:hypothetical protein
MTVRRLTPAGSDAFADLGQTQPAWGENNAGQLGIGNGTGPDQCTTEQTACSLVPVQAKGPHGGTFSRAVEISAGQLHATARQTP